MQNNTQAPIIAVVSCQTDHGLVEAFSLPGHPFFVAVQWHPEWQARDIPFSRLLFQRFISSASASNKE